MRAKKPAMSWGEPSIPGRAMNKSWRENGRDSLEHLTVAVSMVTMTMAMAMAMLISLQFARRRSPARAPGGGAPAVGSIGGIVFCVSLVSGQGWERLDSDVGGGALGACARRGADS